MQLLGTWATEIEIIALALLFQTTIYVYGPCGKSNKWQKHAFESEEANAHLILIKTELHLFNSFKMVGSISNVNAFIVMNVCFSLL